MNTLQIAFACTLVTASSASAQSLYLTDQASYVAGLSDFAVEDFNAGPNNILPDGTLVFDAFSASGDYNGGASIVDNHLYIGGYTTHPTFQTTVSIQFDRPVAAIGMKLLDIGAEVSGGVDYFTFGSTEYFADANPGDFGVIVFSEPITRLTFTPFFSFSMWFEIDDLVIAYAPSPCIADTNHDGMVSPTDFTAWVGAFNSNAPECDQNNDGMCTPTDFTAWVGNYNAGCN